MSLLAKKYREYDFPMFVQWSIDQIVRRISILLSTAYAKGTLMFIRADYERGLTIDGLVRFRCQRSGSIRIGRCCSINSRFGSNLVGRTTPAILQCLGDGNISIGDYVGLSFPVISSRVSVSIGDYTKIGGNVRIFDHNFHSVDWRDRQSGALDQKGIRSAPVKIGENVFIGANAIILKGVTIGDGAIVGAASVVTHDVPAGEVWAGNPCRKVRSAKPETV